ncbi:MAG: glutamyl-tRNA reductase, partial [Dehalococcoidia bacterium]|nr:glutamyl-tRNA reductase [Dehalococcoidia bacterium]
KLAASTLADAGVGRLLVTNRDAERAAEIAGILAAAAVPFERLTEGLAEADIVISSSSAAHCLVTHEMVKNALALRDGKPMLLIDIAVPRDIEPEVRDLPNAHLYDIDDLQSLAQDNLREREKEVGAVEQLVDYEVERFLSWWRSQDVVPTISALRQRAEGIRQAELARTVARMPALSEADRDRLDALTSALMKKLLHEPITRLRDPERGREQSASVRYLFGLDGDDAGQG